MRRVRVANFKFVPLVWVCLVSLGMMAGRVEGASRAVIVVGLTAGETQASRLRAQAEKVRAGFLARGLSPEAIQLVGGSSASPARRETVLAALAPKPAAGAPAAIGRVSAPAIAGSAEAPSVDETWIVLFGMIAPGRSGQPALQVTGPRLTAEEFTAAVTELPGKKLVVVATAGGGGFLEPLLELPDTEAVSATAASGEINEPRFGEFWADVFSVKPAATFLELAADASKRVEAFYTDSAIAQSEHARLIDRTSGKIVQAPFDDLLKAAAAANTPASTPGPTEASAAPLKSAGEIDVPKPSGDLETEQREATAETLAFLAEARAIAEHSPHAGLYLANTADITVDREFSTLEHWRSRAYVRTAEAIDDLATVPLRSDPPRLLARLDGARVIRPDGTQLVLNPRPLTARARRGRDPEAEPDRAAAALPFVELPEVTAGCIVETAWTIERRTTAQIPEFYNEWNFAEKYPVQSLRIRVTTPREERWRTFSPNLPGMPAVSETETTRTAQWSLASIPAHEPLPADAPMRVFTPWVGVSSLPSWDAFAAWYQRLSAGSDEIGSEVKALAAEIGAAHASRADRLRTAYERVAALRYVAIELGVGAFRPRTPEQVWKQRFGDCKDKANLLAAVLNQLGIPAEFALINRFNATFADFPGWQFNHALVRVPAAPGEGQAVDLWLDTTDRLVPFGVIAPGDVGRAAFVFPRNEPARLVNVTTAQEPAAEWREFWQLKLGSSGNKEHGSLVFTAQGASEAHLRRMFASLTPTQRIARVQDLLQASSFTILEVKTGDAYDLTRPFRVEAQVSGVQVRHLAPRPPGFATLFSTPSRSRPLLAHEGRATRYVQEISWSSADALQAGPTPSPVPGATSADNELTGGGVTFRETRQASGRTVEVTMPPGELSPGAYAEARAAWLRFQDLPPTTP
jgi:transglutaminase-like putative cysteine protease